MSTAVSVIQQTLSQESLDNQTVKELQEFCKSKRIKIAKKSKQELINTILWNYDIPLTQSIHEFIPAFSSNKVFTQYRYIIPLLFINPRKQKSEKPVNDELSEFINQAFTKADIKETRGSLNYNNGDFCTGLYTMGVHTCVCGERSKCYDVLLNERFATNSLCEHYLVWHRDEVPENEINKVKCLMNLSV
jgi:hypothetical protein